MTENYQHLEHQTGLILSPLDVPLPNVSTGIAFNGTANADASSFLPSNDDKSTKTSIKCQTTIIALRALRDSNPSLMSKLTHNAKNQNINDDTCIEYWNSIQEILMLHDGDECHMKGLNLGGLMVRIKSMIPFMNALKSETGSIWRKLEILNLGGTDVLLEDLLQSLQSTENNTDKMSIQKLYLSGCSISYQRNGIQNLTSILQCCPNITTLDLRYNDLVKPNQSEADKESLSSLFRDQLSHSNIEILHLEGNNINDDIVDAISDSLSNESCVLKELYLGSNKIEADGARKLALGLECNRVLTKLYIEGNYIGDKGVEEFCMILEKSTKSGDESCIALEKLWVENNGVGKEMMERLGQALQSESTIGGF